MAVVTIPSQYVHFTTKVVNGVTKAVVTIDKAGVPSNAKKIKIKVVYPKISSQGQNSNNNVEQPESGTINMVDLNVNIDENTQYPLTGEFELDGTPQSVEGTIKKMVTYRIAQASIYDIGFDSTPISDAITSDTQAEFLDFNDWNSPGGIAIKGSHY
jgi:hypothetical protein